MNVRQTVTRLRAAVDPLPPTSGFVDIDARLGELPDEDLGRLDVALTRIRELYPRAMRPVVFLPELDPTPGPAPDSLAGFLALGFDDERASR